MSLNSEDPGKKSLDADAYQQVIGEIESYAMFLLDTEGNILTWNKGARNLKGYAAEEIIGKNFTTFYTQEDITNRLPHMLLETARQKGSVNHEGWRVRRNGTIFWASVNITALHDDAGSIIGFSKVTHDLTERKFAEERLRESEERYHSMISEVQDYAIILLDRDGNIEDWNAGAAKIKGYTRQEILGKNFRIFYTPQDAHLPDRLLTEAAEEGRVSHEGWRVRKDGSLFWGSIVITALHDPQGNVTSFSKVTRDLTERKKSEDELKDSAAELEEIAAELEFQNKALETANRELESFTYVASHDLKEPLRKIRVFASQVEEIKDMPDKGLEVVRKISASAARMQRLIDDLLAYSSVSSGAWKEEPIDLNELLKSILMDLEVSMQEKKAVVESKTLPVIEGVPFQFQQVFLNLISNALKFSRAGVSPVIKIDYELQPASSRYAKPQHHITISDNGIGFESQFSERIFETFQRLHTTQAVKGTGIGLSIVKKIIERHGGVVKAVGKPGEGATFQIWLPADNLINKPI